MNAIALCGAPAGWTPPGRTLKPMRVYASIALLEVGHADHHVVDASEHVTSLRPCSTGSRRKAALYRARRHCPPRRARCKIGPSLGPTTAGLVRERATRRPSHDQREERPMATDKHAPPTFETVLYETKGPLCYITLNRPEKLNAATDQLVEDVNDALFEFDADEELHGGDHLGRGPGVLLGRRRAASASSARARSCAASAGRPGAARARTASATTVNWKPVIAAVHGYALGLGYSLSPVVRPRRRRGGHEVPDPRGAARPRRRPALGGHVVLDGQPLRQRGRAHRPHVHGRGGASARHGQPRGPAARS